jgi:hypothetical protein
MFFLQTLPRPTPAYFAHFPEMIGVAQMERPQLGMRLAEAAAKVDVDGRRPPPPTDEAQGNEKTDEAKVGFLRNNNKNSCNGERKEEGRDIKNGSCSDGRGMRGKEEEDQAALQALSLEHQQHQQEHDHSGEWGKQWVRALVVLRFDFEYGPGMPFVHFLEMITSYSRFY